MSKNIKITICPPAPQDVFFQEQQFEENLPGRSGLDGTSQSGNRGTDPIVYWRGGYSSRKKLPRAPLYASKAKETKLKNAAKDLKGHENKEEILKILRSGL